MILTDDECRKVYNEAMELPGRTALVVTRAIIAAYEENLRGGVELPGPAKKSCSAFGKDYQYWYSADQLLQYGAAQRLAARECEGWKLSKDGLPPIGTEVVGGHFYQDTWLKGKPTVFAWGRCVVVADTHSDFKDGKRWQTFGPSHNDITHWKYPPASPQEQTK